MLFNSFQFLIFFITIAIFNQSLSKRASNLFLLAASYFFYACWDWRFLSLIALSTGIDYICGAKIASHSKDSKRKLFLCLSIVSNLTILSVFKYANFFIESFIATVSIFGLSSSFSLNLILPIGISFYTFQSMSYTIDIYKKEIKPTKSLVNFALFVSFFPQLVAGPIERAKHFIPQIESKRTFKLNHFYQGSYLIFWGLFLKVFCADNLAYFVNDAYDNVSTLNTAKAWLAFYSFSFQIYCDFAGYCSIARGTARILGFDICENFRWPYFSSNIREFWQRWHISLSSWFKDYLYIPLGGNRVSSLITIRNLCITFLLAGLWHGADWNFVLWGALHTTILIIYLMIKSKQKNKTAHSKLFLKRILFFHLICLTWIPFRSPDLMTAFQLLTSMCNLQNLTIYSTLNQIFIPLGFYVIPVLMMDYFQSRANNRFILFNLPFVVRGIVYFVLLFLLIIFGQTNAQEFIYFQF